MCPHLNYFTIFDISINVRISYYVITLLFVILLLMYSVLYLFITIIVIIATIMNVNLHGNN